MVTKKTSVRRTILMNADVHKKLEDVVLLHHNYVYRTNTMIQAAILAFSEMTEKQQKEYLVKVSRMDGRWR